MANVRKLPSGNVQVRIMEKGVAHSGVGEDEVAAWVDLATKRAMATGRPAPKVPVAAKPHTVRSFYEQVFTPARDQRLTNGTLELSSRDDDRNLMAYVLPSLGERRLASITPDDVAGLRDYLLHEYVKRNGRVGLAPQSVDNVMKKVKLLFGMADMDVATGDASHVAIQAKEVQYLPLAKARGYITHLRANASHQLYTAHVVYQMLALRNAEACALRWEDIDWDEAMVTVSWSLDSRGRPKPRTKGHRQRKLAIPPTVLDALRMQRKLQREGGIDTPYVVSTQLGTVMNGDNLRHYLWLAGGVNPQLLRSTWATLMEDAEVNRTWVQQTLGHADVDTLSASYSPMTDTRRRAVATATEQLFG